MALKKEKITMKRFIVCLTILSFLFVMGGTAMSSVEIEPEIPSEYPVEEPFNIESFEPEIPSEYPVEERVNTGLFESADPKPVVAREIERKIKPSFEFDGADHVANGVALRNRTSGTIHLRGVPVGSKVLQALLYWNFSDRNKEGLDTFPVLFNGNLLNGKKTADSADPCWGMAGSHSYVADATQYVNTGGHPNQDYEVVLLFDSSTSTTGQNPWSPWELQDVRTQGATLIVIYENRDTRGPLFVYDDLNNSMFYSYAQFQLLYPYAPLSTHALFTMVGADGQLGFGHNTFLSNELTFFNGIRIAGCPVTNSDWDGSDGWPLVQLWDTHTHIVTLNSGTSSSTVEYKAYGDCLVPVAFVIDAK